MTEQHTLFLQQIKETARQLSRAGQDVRAKLRDLTLQALTRGELAEREIREVLLAITEGVSLGAAERAEEVRGALQEALGGIDDALANAAEAMQQALGEAGAQAREFAEGDLKQGLDELKKLEQMFLETMRRVAGSASGLVKQELNLLAEHAGHTGTGTGRRVKEVTEKLAGQLLATAHEASDAGKRAAIVIGARVAARASSKLAEIADKIQRKADSMKQDQPHP